MFFWCFFLLRAVPFFLLSIFDCLPMVEIAKSLVARENLFFVTLSTASHYDKSVFSGNIYQIVIDKYLFSLSDLFSSSN